jgi:hypothetical protein
MNSTLSRARSLLPIHAQHRYRSNLQIHRLAAFLLLVWGCGQDARTDRAQPAGSGTAAMQYSLADFQALRYLEGDWRGSGYEGGPFYETYRFADDSTIEMTAWTDSTMTVAQEHSQYLFRDGVIRTSKGALLTSVDEDGHHFETSSYGWTFTPATPDRWNARVGPSTVYTMDRIVRP